MNLYEQIQGKPAVVSMGALNIPDAIVLDAGISGINKALLKADPAGLCVHVPSAHLINGDKVDIYFSNVSSPVLSLVVPKDHDANKPLSGFIDAKQVPEGFSELFYRVNGAESAHLKILTRKRSPGGRDPEPQRPGHGLLTAPRTADTEVDGAEDVPVAIDPWRGMRAGHKLNLQIANWCLPYTVESGEEGQPVVFILTREMIAELGNRDVLMFYRLWDEVGNPATDRSLTRTIRVRPTVGTMGVALNAPRIGDVDLDNVIDLGKTGESDVLVEVDVAANGLTAGQQIKLNWRGEPLDGPPQLLTLNQTVGEAPSVVFSISPSMLSQWVGSWVSATWMPATGDGFHASAAVEFLLIDTSNVVPLEAPDDSALVLWLPIIPGQVEPVEGGLAMVGIPKMIYDDNPAGLAVIIDPWDGMAPNETCRLFLNGEATPVDIHLVGPGTENDPFTMHVPPQRLINGVNSLVYSVERPSSNDEFSSPLTMLYHEVRPGYVDQDPATEGHSELALAFPIAQNNGIDIVKEGLDGTLQQLTVHCRYPFCRLYDHVDIDFGGHIVHFSVPADQAPPVPSITPTTVTVIVPASELDQIENRRALPVRFTVTDLIENSTDPLSIWSATTYIDVDRRNERLPAPIFREDLADENDDASLIDLDKLAGRPLSLIISTSHPSYRAGDEVSAIFKSPPDPDYIVPVGIVQTELGQPKPLVLQVPNNLLVADRDVSCAYDVRFKTLNREGYSTTAFAKVVGFGELQLPNLLEADGMGASQVLAPLDAINGATVRIALAGLLSTDMIKLILTGKPGEGTPDLAPVPGEVDGSVDIPIPASVIAANIGNGINATFTLRYELLRGGETFASGTVTVTVTPLPATSLNLPVFFINNAEELNVLNLNSFTGDAVIRAKLWSFIAAGQQVRMSLEGRTPDNNPSNRTIWNGAGSKVTPEWITNGFWPVTVPRAYLDTLGDGTQLIIKFSASLDLRDDAGTDIDFPDRVYRVGIAGQAPVITSVKAGATEIPPGSDTFETRITVSGTITPSRGVDLYDGDIRLGSATVTGNTWSMGPLTFLPALHTLTARALDGTTSFPAWAFTVKVETQTPTITAVITDEGVVADQGETYYRSATITGSGTGTTGQEIELLDNNVSIGRFPVNSANEWTVQCRLFSAETHTLTVRAVDGSGKRSTRVFRVLEGLSLHIAKFSERLSGGWLWGGAGSSSDLSWYAYPNQTVYFMLNITRTNNSAGTFLTRTFTGMTPGATYLLSSSAFRYNAAVGAITRLQLGTSHGERSAEVVLDTLQVAKQILLSFVATSPTMTMLYINNEALGTGNDFCMTHIQIQRMQLPS
ncbi:hypothetical protein [Pseudomonas sp. D1-36]|uniref:hypothetical protein n=1 Tax=Pseudomonas sp. D1-36 TaxID=2817387 RepID=UPI003DA94E01